MMQQPNRSAPPAADVDLTAAALAEVFRLRHKYQADRNAIVAQIISFGDMRPEPTSAGPSFGERVRSRMNGNVAMLAGHLPDGIRLSRLLEEKAELDFIIDKILSQQEVIARSALKAAYDLSHAAEFDAADREAAQALLRLKHAAEAVFRQDLQSREKTGLARGRQLEGHLNNLFFGGPADDAIENLVASGTITRQQADEAETELRKTVG
jgi:hypothetical protein